MNCLALQVKAESLFLPIEDSNLSCACDAVPKTMVHRISCPACPKTCMQEELVAATDSALGTAAQTQFQIRPLAKKNR